MEPSPVQYDKHPIISRIGGDLLNLSHAPISDSDLACFAESDAAAIVAKITTLWLDGTAIGDVGLGHLSVLKNLRVLNLKKTLVTDTGLAHLRGLTKLKLLILSGTAVTDAGLDHLKPLGLLQDCEEEDDPETEGNLQQVDLTGTRVTSAGRASLAEVVPEVVPEVVYEAIY